MSEIPDPKENLINWSSREHLVLPGNIGKWHKGSVYNRYPNKAELREGGLAAIAQGWLPERPIIGPETRVLAVGSCFARHFIVWLAEHGYNRNYPESPYNALLRFGSEFESPAVIAQQFRWAFDELEPATLLWIDKNRHLIAATEEGKRAARATLEQTDVLILTLGLSEVWYDKASGEPLWRGLTEDLFDPERHVFRIEPVDKTIEWLECIDRLRQRHLPGLKIVFTVSPIPLRTTFRPVSAITANAASKAILRAALDEFLRRHEADLNRRLFYFPSYEMVTQFFMEPHVEDNRHLAPIVPGTIVDFFARHYCEDSLQARREGSLEAIPGGIYQEQFLRHAALGEKGVQSRELLARIAELEAANVTLQRICEERQVVIDGLDRAARERLALIERLDAELKRTQTL